MATRKLLTVNVDQVLGLADKLKDLTGPEIAAANVRAINETADWAYDLGRERITVGINLSDDYLRRRMRLEPATPQRPVAEITAAGGRDDMTRLMHYDAKMVVTPKKISRTRGTGVLGIPSGQRQAGVAVQVRRGSEKTMDYAFLLPLRRGAVAGGNGQGVFTRSTDGRLKQRYGPSVYQLFKYQLETDYVDQAEEQLIERLGQYAEETAERMLK